MPSAFDLLHPAVQRQLWEMKWEELRPIQIETIRHLAGGGGDCIIASPTASGKTEAAFLPVLSAIADDFGGSIRAMYVGPLKALINDQFRRVEELCKRMELPVHKWHGDVGNADRKAVLQTPSGVLLITPESLEAMFIRRPTQMPALFKRLGFVVIDELHAFLGSVRGAQLLSQLFRLRARAGCDPVRIGLSATLGDRERALKWLRPDSVVPGKLIEDPQTKSDTAIRVRGLWRPRTKSDDDEKEGEDASLVEVARGILVACRGATNLVFANNKSQIEALADELKTQAAALQLPDEIVVHHGSLSKETRETTEERLRADRPCTAVCSNTLELGIDIGQIDTVVQVSAPWSVASLVQRLGRGGRRGGERRLRAFFVENAPTKDDGFWDSLHLDFLRGVATIELMIEGFREPPDLGRAQWSTLIQQLLSTVAETGGIKAAALYPRLFDSGAFARMSRSEFALLLRALGARELIEQDASGLLILGRLGERIVDDYTFYAAFRAAEEFRVLHGLNPIGMLPETAIPPVGEHVILAGRRWQVQEIDGERREVAVIPSRGRRPPQFDSGRPPVHSVLHEKMRALACGAGEPRYLDEGAREILQHIRATARNCRKFEPRIQIAPERVRLILFKGTRITRTLRLALLMTELSVVDEDVGLDVKGDLDQVRRSLRAFYANPDRAALAALADDKLHARTLGGEKWDHFLPDELWQKAYCDEQLDVEGAVSVAKELVLEIERAQRPAPARPIVQSTVRGLDVIAGLSLTPSSSLTEFDDLAAGEARLEQIALGPDALLRDLELRLGLAVPDVLPVVRVAHWSARLAALAPRGRFYSRSYQVDAWGTASELLTWRDLLVEAGWDGAPIPNGGERLSHLAEAEILDGATPLPPSFGDRLRTVAEMLARAKSSIYARLRLVEPEALWSSRWREVFARLRGAGCAVEKLEFVPALAPPSSDLGRMQQYVLEGRAEPVRLEGDGSLLFVRGETTWETAHAVAALARMWSDSTVIIRQADAAPLDFALQRAGLATLGTTSASRLRPLLQVLPLALELAFDPKDPYRVLELLALPDGPFRGRVGARLADALADMPGIGSPRWNEEKAKLDGERRLARVAEWIEAPGHPQSGAPREALLAVVRRVEAWLQGRMAIDANEDESGALLGVAYAQTRALEEALIAEPRAQLGLVQLRQLIETTAGAGAAVAVHAEQAGRIDRVTRPAALLSERETVIWWGCTARSAETPAPAPFTRTERDTLAAANVVLVDPRAQMAEAAAAWRRSLLAARQRLILAAPRRELGEELAVHPFWDELQARTGGDRGALALVTRDARAILAGSLGSVATVELKPGRLPEPRASWRAPAAHLTHSGRASATSIETLLGCPLRWVLEYRTGLHRGGLVSIPADRLLYGRLGHRLVQSLHQQSAFKLENFALRTLALKTLDEILPTEGATLLLPGRRGEREQVRNQLADAAVRLCAALHRADLELVEVEKTETVAWRGRDLIGRLDVLLVNRERRDVVLDLKWGQSTYSKKLQSGTAIQLAVYAYLRKQSLGASAFPAVGYFSLSTGKLLTTDGAFAANTIDGDDIASTWSRADATVALVEAKLATGEIPVALAPASVIEACGAARGDRRHLALAADAACRYCDHDAICGLRWSRS